MQPVNKLSISPGNKKWDIFPPFLSHLSSPVQMAANAWKSVTPLNCAGSAKLCGRHTGATWPF